ncbi:hypothetical protein Y027_6312 [Burkholderia pseudomallei TSV5]|nr:hypothetical protein Y025_6320 [Burkholderia pseudomallei TSV32]KGX63763.1 hypothetical protein Y027_6312 [Burkholderia pseudomallei TSV5]
MIDEPDLDAIRDRDVLGIVDRERGVRDADDDRAGLLAFGGYGNQRSGFRNLLLRDDLRQVEHPADAGLVVEDLFLEVAIRLNGQIRWRRELNQSRDDRKRRLHREQLIVDEVGFDFLRIVLRRNHAAQGCGFLFIVAAVP